VVVALAEVPVVEAAAAAAVHEANVVAAAGAWAEQPSAKSTEVSGLPRAVPAHAHTLNMQNVFFGLSSLMRAGFSESAASMRSTTLQRSRFCVHDMC
jgi:hypothetical protein